MSDASRALAVTGYTLLELSRRRVLLVIVIVAVLLTAGLGIAPLVIPGAPTGAERSLFTLNSLSSVIGLAIQICAFAVGMTIINHDLDSGALVAILVKPLTRLGYAGGKLAAAVAVLLFLTVLFAGGVLLLVALNGGGHTPALLAFFAVTAANAGLLMVMVMILTVYLNNIVAALIVFFFTIVQSAITGIKTFVDAGLMTDSLLKPIVNVLYWIVPHPLKSNLEREIVSTLMSLHPTTRPPGPRGRVFDPLATIPAASNYGDILFWAAYVAALCLLLYLALRRKQV